MNKKNQRLMALWLTPSGQTQAAIAVLCALMMAAEVLLVGFTNRERYMYSYLMFMPVILLGFFFREKGGFIGGLLGGVALVLAKINGIDRVDPDMLANWVLTVVVFTVTGWAVGQGAGLFERLYRGSAVDQQPLVLAIDSVIRDRGKQPGQKVLIVLIDNYNNLCNSFGKDIGGVLRAEIIRRVRFLVSHKPIAIVADPYVGIIWTGENADFVELVTKIQGQMEIPIQYHSNKIICEVTVGMTEVYEEDTSAEDVVRRATFAAFDARERGTAYATYDRDRHDTMREMILLGSEVKQAVDEDQFVLHYHPIINVKDRTVVGAEALIRWNHPIKGYLPPLAFIPVLEEFDKIAMVQRWIFLKIAEVQRRQQERQKIQCDLVFPTMAMNISAKALQGDQPWCRYVHNFVKENAWFDPRKIIFELTETAILEDFDAAEVTLQNLREMGFGVAIDDFGTGQSSLAYVKKIPADILKIGKEFIINVNRSDEDTKMIRMILELGKMRKMVVVAEGVETEDAFQWLKNAGCGLAQGFLFAKPMPEDEYQAWLEEYNRSLVAAVV